MTPIQFAGLTVGGGSPLLLIAGPCVIESETHAVGLALALRDIAKRAGVQYVFKASFDKANRTSARSFRGPGLDEGLRILGRVREAAGVPILTDIHEPWQAARAAEVADVLQIPAFLVRQTDLVVAAAATGRVVNLKKGQFLAPDDMRHAIEKVTGAGNRAGDRDRARYQLRLPQSRGGHARLPHPAPPRLPGGLRRHAQPAAARRRRRRHRRAGRVHRADGVGRRGRRRGRRVHGSARAPVSRQRATRRTRCGWIWLEALLHRLVRIHAIAHEIATAAAGTPA